MSDEPFADWMSHVDAGRIGPHLGIAATATAGEEQPAAPNVRTFSMNSAEGFEALRTPRERPWIPRGSLPPGLAPTETACRFPVQFRSLHAASFNSRLRQPTLNCRSA